MVSSMIKPELKDSDRYNYTMDIWKKIIGENGRINIDYSTFLNKRKSSDANYSLAYLMKGKGAFPEGVNIDKTLEFYL